MKKIAIRLLTLAILSLTLAAAPVVTAVYAAPDNDPPPPPQTKKKKSSEARPGSEQTAFADGYRAAYADDLRPPRLCRRDCAVEGARA